MSIHITSGSGISNYAKYVEISYSNNQYGIMLSTTLFFFNFST